MPRNCLVCAGGALKMETWRRISSHRTLAAKSPDDSSLPSIITGCPWSASSRWAILGNHTRPNTPPVYSQEDLTDRAWDVQQRVQKKLVKNSGHTHEAALWIDACGDVTAGFSQGPFVHESEVASRVGTAASFPTTRIAVEQGSE